jgi:hypothetical protein
LAVAALFREFEARFPLLRSAAGLLSSYKKCKMKREEKEQGESGF